MSRIIKKIDHAVVKKTAARCKAHGITIPTFAQMRDPETMRLTLSAASVAELFRRAAAGGVHMGTLTRGLLALLDTHGAAALERAISAALAQDAAHLGAVRHFIDLHAHADSLAPPIAVALPADPRIAAITVRPHSLRDYDQLARSTHEQEQGSDNKHTDDHDRVELTDSDNDTDADPVVGGGT